MNTIVTSKEEILKTSRELIRTGARSALVTAVFTGVPPLAWLVENWRSTGREELLLQRELTGDGKNLCRVNGRPVTVAQLRRIGEELLNIHGQHDGQPDELARIDLKPVCDVLCIFGHMPYCIDHFW